MAKALIGKMPAKDIARRLGVSLSSLKRAFRGTRLAYFNRYAANPQLVLKVCKYYEKHGRLKTQEKFPDVSVRSIVERYGNERGLAKPRQIRWTDKQVIEAARMGGVISFDGQAKYFNRPRANEGSIKALWMKRFELSGGQVNGMSAWMAKYLVTEKCPFIQTKFWNSRRHGAREFSRRLYLWVDMEKHLRSDCNETLRDAIVALAKFQRWLHGSENPKRKILAMIRARDRAT